MMRRATEDVQARIGVNRRALERSGRTVSMGTILAACAVPAGLIAFLVAYRLS